MSYSDHLRRFKAKQQAQRDDATRREDAARIALEESYRHAGELIRGVLRPEMEALREALESAGVQAKVTVGRGRAVGLDADYEVEVVLADEGARMRFLKFEADAARRIFTATLSTGSGPEQQLSEVHRYDQVIPQLAKDCCAAFLERAFPV